MKHARYMVWICMMALVPVTALMAAPTPEDYVGSWQDGNGHQMTARAQDGSLALIGRGTSFQYEAQCTPRGAFFSCAGSGKRITDNQPLNINLYLFKRGESLSIRFAMRVLGSSGERGRLTLNRSEITPEPPAPVDPPNIQDDETETQTEISFQGCPTGNENVTPHNAAFEREVLRLVNAERARRNLSALSWDDDLARAARYHAADMATENYFSHDSRDRRNGRLVQSCETFERISKFASSAGAENIAAGNNTPAAVMNQWMNSTGHRENILRAGLTRLGVGMFKRDGSDYTYYWVQNFGR